MEDLQDYHDILDAFDIQTKEIERRARVKQKRNAHR
jgi:hypothetical protein